MVIKEIVEVEPKIKINYEDMERHRNADAYRRFKSNPYAFTKAGGKKENDRKGEDCISRAVPGTD